MIYNKLWFPLVILLAFSSIKCLAQSHFKNKIQLQSSCFWEQKPRKIVDTLKKQIAFIVKKNNIQLLVINNKKYFACNLPETISSSKILITGYVLQTLQTEKVIATPLKLISAYSY